MCACPTYPVALELWVLTRPWAAWPHGRGRLFWSRTSPPAGHSLDPKKKPTSKNKKLAKLSQISNVCIYYSTSLSPCLSFFLSFPPCFLASLPAFFFVLSFTCHTICIYIFTCIILHASNGFTGDILQSSNMPGTGHAGTSCSGIAPNPIFCCYHGSQDDRNATQNTQPL